MKKSYPKTPLAVKSASMIEALCEPLFDKTRITNFGYVDLSKDKTVAVVSSHEKFLDLYLKKNYYNYDVHALNATNNKQYIIWDLLNVEGGTKELNDDREAFNIGHTLTIMKQDQNRKECFHFSGMLGDTAINGFYLQYTDLLENFILYFKEQMMRKDLKKMYDERHKLDTNHMEFCTDQLAENQLLSHTFHPQKYILKDSHLTQREIHCLSWLSQGKVMEEIAELLQISRRTVKAHIENCKQKLRCDTLFQLGQMYHELELWRFFK